VPARFAGSQDHALHTLLNASWNIYSFWLRKQE